MKKLLINSESAAAVLFMITGLAGIIFRQLALGIATLSLIIAGIYLLYKRKLDSGLITLAAGIVISLLSWFFQGIIYYLSWICLIIGIAMYIVYGIIKR